MNKIETKKAVVSFLIAAVVLVSVVGTASAVSITWYFNSTASTVNGADYWMSRQWSDSGDKIGLYSGNTFTWCADEAAQVDVTFCAENWSVHLDYTRGIQGGYLESGETVTAKIGILESDGTFTEKCSNSEAGSGSSTGGESDSMISISCPSFTVPQGDYLAVKVSMAGGKVRIDAEGSASTITSPTCGDPYPTPELATLVLFGTGLLALAGFVLYNRRKEDRK